MSRAAKAVQQRRRDEQYNDVFRAIATADTAPTKREIALETHRSDGQVQRILRDLREYGRVRRVRDPEDGRIIRYEITTRTDQ
ncbi:MarR family transcriptional regulator [Haloterrigena sp. SYSU A558-1]|uniref:MarR family transcriptional regulator n=1 Tax=Haloterrigena gelatinilytica TaxID=2741724 RepID=A0ABX2LMC9_9EURY|nr:winged helix DNA-binding protein [Haloterrigena gelatinilytica]NUC74976.1 MarR family transcriptional regulator [Haloterrigena gelatinilytica]